MRATVVGIVCLITALVEVHSQTVPYISFMNETLPNHTYVDINHVSQYPSHSVQCHTDLTTCCSSTQGSDRGNWYFPNGTRLPLPPTVSGLGIIYFARTNMEVQLRRQLNSVEISGIYRCDIETKAANNDGWESVYAGVYFSGGDVTIRDSVHFTKVSDLNGEHPQFTLTCITTGGPATTVTWTRDSEDISGGVTVLDNAITAQYTHTLTVTGRLPGQYQCTVSNNKPSQALTSFTVEVATAPTNLTAVQEGLTGIRVSWIPPTHLGETTGYRIYYQGGSSGSVDVSGGSTDKHLLTHLKNGAAYTISIVGTSKHFFSNPMDYPNSIPLSMPIAEVSSATATTISLSWSVPSGSVDTYVVMWERDTSGECPVEDRGNKTLNGGYSSYTIGDLEEDSNYTIILTAISASGSAVSDPVTRLTKEAVPSAAPTSVHTSNVTFSSITVQWGAVDCIHQNGNVTGYFIRYWVQRSNTHTVNVSGGAVMVFTLTGLPYSTAYSIDVAAINNAGIGKYSDSITVKTMGYEETGGEGEGGEGCDTCSQNKGSDHTEVLALGVVGGFVGGIFLTVSLGVIILVVLLQRMRPKRDVLSTSTNPAYGQVEGVKTAEYEMCGMPSGAAMATQEPTYETVPT